jgi:hypothetical protein
MTKADKHYLHYIHTRKAAILNDSANTTAGYWKDIYRIQYAELDMMERVIKEAAWQTKSTRRTIKAK